MTVKQFMSIHSIKSLANTVIYLTNLSNNQKEVISKYSIDYQDWWEVVANWYDKEIVDITYIPHNAQVNVCLFVQNAD